MIVTADLTTSPDIRTATQRWAAALHDLVDATGLSVRQLANHVPWAHQTLARYIKGERVVDDAWLLAGQLLELVRARGNVVHADPAELRTLFLQARTEYLDKPKNQTAEAVMQAAEMPEPAPEPVIEPVARKPRWYHRKMVLILLIVAILGGGTVAVGAFSGWFHS